MTEDELEQFAKALLRIDRQVSCGLLAESVEAKHVALKRVRMAINEAFASAHIVRIFENAGETQSEPDTKAQQESASDAS